MRGHHRIVVLELLIVLTVSKVCLNEIRDRISDRGGSCFVDVNSIAAGRWSGQFASIQKMDTLPIRYFFVGLGGSVSIFRQHFRKGVRVAELYQCRQGER